MHRRLRTVSVSDLGGPTWLVAGDLLLVTPAAPSLRHIEDALARIRLLRDHLDHLTGRSETPSI